MEPFIAVAPAASQPAAADRAGAGAAVRAVAVTAMQAGRIFRSAELPSLLRFPEVARIRWHVAHGDLHLLAGSSIRGGFSPAPGEDSVSTVCAPARYISSPGPGLASDPKTPDVLLEYGRSVPVSAARTRAGTRGHSPEAEPGPGRDRCGGRGGGQRRARQDEAARRVRIDRWRTLVSGRAGAGN